MDLYGDLLGSSADVSSGWTQDIKTLAAKNAGENKESERANTKMMPSTVASAVSASAAATSTSSTSKVFKPMTLSSSSAMKPRQAVAAVPSVFLKAQLSTSVTTEVRKKPGEKTDMTEVVETREKVSLSSTTFDVEDPYDPTRPNDYVLWCEERLERKKKQKLEEENQRYLAELEEERQERVKERQEALQSGNIDLVQAMSIGRGRGRGVSILPAWMTSGGDASLGKVSEKDAKPSGAEGQFCDHQQIGAASRADRRFIDPSCVILIENMVAPEDIDDMLVQETSDECRKYGAVKQCVVHKLRGVPEEESVRIFVAFHNLDCAKNAHRDLKGRFFGGRKVRASFYEQNKFDARDFES